MTAPTAFTGRRVGVRFGPIGVPWRPRLFWGCVGLFAGCLALVVYAVLAGRGHALPLDRVLPILLGQGDPIEQIVMDRRLPRALVGFAAGFALGAAGAITQSITRNPLASPDILGVTNGASLGAVLLLTAVRGAEGWSLTGAALVGGLVTTAIVVALSWKADLSGLRLILSGIAVSSFCSAMIAWQLLRTDIDTAERAQRWLTGSLGSVTPADAGLVLPIVSLGAAALIVMSNQLGALRFSNDTATSLGVRPSTARLRQLALAVGLVCVVTAVTGPIGFIGFVAPQLAMRMLRTAGPPPIAGGLLGALVVLAADRLVQLLPVTLPVGAITALVGAPILIVLLLRGIRRSDA